MSGPVAWFQTRDAGQRWGAPRTWQGWVVYGLVAVAILGTGHVFPPRKALATFIFLALVISAFSIAVCWAKGDGRTRR